MATFDSQRRPRWSPQDLGEFIDQVRDDRLFALWMLVATTGIRLDTLLDLRRGDVDMQEAVLSVLKAAAEKVDAALVEKKAQTARVSQRSPTFCDGLLEAIRRNRS